MVPLSFFLKELKKRHPNEHIVIVWDNAPFHRPKFLRDIPNVTIIAIPPYSPQLSPTERFFEETRKAQQTKHLPRLRSRKPLSESESKRLQAIMRTCDGYAGMSGYWNNMKMCFKDCISVGEDWHFYLTL